MWVLSSQANKEDNSLLLDIKIEKIYSVISLSFNCTKDYYSLIVLLPILHITRFQHLVEMWHDTELIQKTVLF